MEDNISSASPLEIQAQVIEKMIAWSEWGGGVLNPEYLALHESIIGIHADYHMWKYLAAFLSFVEPLNCGLEEIGFFYSHEDGPTVPPALCTKQRFYFYTYNCSLEKESKEITLEHFLNQNPDPVRIKAFRAVPKDLLDQLNKYHYVQPYILLHDGQNSSCRSEIICVSGCTLEKMLEEFGQYGYQFSLYAYKFKDSKKLEAPAWKSIFRLAFIVHILTWNHDLKTAHAVLKSVHRTTRRVEELRIMLDSTFTELSGELNQVFYSQRKIPTLPCESINQIDQGWHLEFPSDATLKLHGLPDIRSSQDKWFEYIKSNPRLHDYVDFVNFFVLKSDAPLPATQGNAAVAAWLLSREIDRKEPSRVGLWVDQVCVALFRGLNFEFGRRIPIQVTYFIDGYDLNKHGIAQDLCRRLFYDSRSAKRKYQWKGYASPGILAKFVGAGWVRENENISRAPYLNTVHWHGPAALKRFLDQLSVFVHAAASQQPSRTAGWVRLVSVKVDFVLKRVATWTESCDASTGWPSAELTITLRCTNEPHLERWGNSGTWVRQILALANACGQISLRAFDTDLAEGFYARKRRGRYSDWVIRLAGTNSLQHEYFGDQR